MAFGHRHRTIVESARFSAEAKAIQPDARRMDEIMHGVTWALSNVAERIGQPTAVAYIRALPTRVWPNAPAMILYYSYDDDTVTLLSIRLAIGADDDDVEAIEED
jgi:hypothetical protein